MGTFDLTGLPPAPKGVPKIEVTFDIDANGILNLSAVETAAGKTEKITIKNDSNRLSEQEIEAMVAEGERFKDDDAKVRETVEKKNGLENYCFQMKNQLEEEKLKDKFTDDDKKVISESTKETLQWLEGN